MFVYLDVVISWAYQSIWHANTRSCITIFTQDNKYLVREFYRKASQKKEKYLSLPLHNLWIKHTSVHLQFLTTQSRKRRKDANLDDSTNVMRELWWGLRPRSFEEEKMWHFTGRMGERAILRKKEKRKREHYNTYQRNTNTML